MIVVLLSAVVVSIAVLVASQARRGTRMPGAAAPLPDAEAQARRWVERLGAGVAGLDDRGDPAATQALADASERYSAACAQLGTARTITQFALVEETAVEGLHYIRAARLALGLDPGPEVPAPVANSVAAQHRIVVGGQEYRVSPEQGAATPYYYAGGSVAGRRLPAGWYDTPWWQTALVAGAAGIGGALPADTLLDGLGGLGRHHHHGGFGFGGPGFGDFGGPGPF